MAKSTRNNICETIAKKLEELLEDNHNNKNTHRSSIKRQPIHFAEVSGLLIELYNNSLTEKYYWFDCPPPAYEVTLDNRITKNPKALNELNFLIDEYMTFDNPIMGRFFSYYSYSDYINKRSNDAFERARIEKLTYLRKRILNKYRKVIFRIGEDYSLIDPTEFIPDYFLTTKKEKNDSNSIEWKGSQTEFVELIKSLVEAKSISGTQTNIIKVLSEVLNFNIKSPDKKIQDIKNRKNGGETLFLDKLKSALFQYIAK
jgi:hypothetical protein